jgi:hypothetical protein
MDRIRGIIDSARQTKEIATDADDDTITLLIFEIYQIEARRWLAGTELDVEAGLCQCSQSCWMGSADIRDYTVQCLVQRVKIGSLDSRRGSRSATSATDGPGLPLNLAQRRSFPCSNVIWASR